MNKDDALKLALEALELYPVTVNHWKTVLLPAAQAIREALADSALDRMAENARELGLDYEPPCKTGSQCTSKCPQCEQPAQQLHCNDCGGFDPECPLAQPAQKEQQVSVPVTDNTYNYAKNLAESIFKQHFASDEHYASGRIVWDVNDTVIGILTQIDNMVADMVRRPAQQRPQNCGTGYCSCIECLFVKPAQQPVARSKAYDMIDRFLRNNLNSDEDYTEYSTALDSLYTSPPASKPWVGLTDDEMRDLEKQFNAERVRTSDEEYLVIYPGDYWAWQRAIEAKLKDKNGY